jgi:hypothetical protein
MSRITISDLNTVNQVTELSEVELAATKGGFFGIVRLLFGGYGRSYNNGCSNYNNGCAPKSCHY